jgi:exonuclease SbcC
MASTRESRLEDKREFRTRAVRNCWSAMYGRFCGVGLLQVFAEVDFVGHDGLSYRSRWAVARARGKANGRLQNAQRTLHRLSDDTAVADGITSVLREVEARTNLTFHQFRRTVLLAQGDFDAFLLASESDRSDLLEKVTGTEIYGVISMQVRQGTEQLSREVATLDLRRRDIGLLEPTARTALEEAQESLQSIVDSYEEERTKVNGKLERQRALSVARENLRLAEVEFAGALQRRRVAEPDFAAQTERDQAEELRTLQVLAASAASALPVSAQRVMDAERFETTTKASKALAEERLATADKAATAAEEAFKNFGPIWTEAEGLDAQIVLADEEVKTARKEYERVDEAVKAQELLQRKLQDQLTLTSKEYEDARRAVEAKAGVAQLSERFDDVVVLLERHAKEVVTSKRMEASVMAAGEQLEKLGSKVSSNAANIEAADLLRSQLLRAADALRMRLVEQDEDALQSSESELSQLVIDLREAQRIAERAGTAAGSLSIAEAAAAESYSEREEAVHEIAEAEARLDRDSAARALMIPLNDLAEQSISEQAEHLRGFVLDGKECPVCGATEHPYLESEEGLEPSGALQTLATSLRSQRHKLDASIQVSTSARTRAMGKLAAAEARNSQAAINAQAARIDASKAMSDYEELKPTLATVLGAHGLPNELPKILDGNATSLIAERAQLAKAAYVTAKKGLAGVRKLRTELEQAQKQEAAAQKSVETKTTNHLQLTAQKHGAELALEQERANQRQNKTELDSMERDLPPFLASIGLEVEILYRDPVDVLARVNEEANGYRALKTHIGELELVMRRLEPALAAAQADTGSRKEQQVNCKAALEQRRTSLELKLAERKQLLGGEATASHRTQHNQIRLAAIGERQLRHSQQGDTSSAYQGAIVAYENAKVAHEDAELLAWTTQSNFTEACAAIDRSSAWVIERLLMTTPLRDEIRDRLRGIDDAVTTAQAKRTTRFGDVETATMEVDESESITELSTSLVLLGQQITVKQNEMGENAANLKRDDQAQANAATLATEIEAKRKHLAVWQAVDDAVGSADGSRFRKFVQGITLEHLIMLANDHLSALGPRYQLSQSGSSELAVHVIDKEMADELRAARSLSGGERFLVSLSLALALSGLEGRSSFVDTLFIDEGFGTLDRDTLDIAVDALEALQSHGRKVAVITHVEAMIDRIAVQVRVEKLGGGHSVIKLTEGVVI